jgi:FkbM family methyltransferase
MKSLIKTLVIRLIFSTIVISVIAKIRYKLVLKVVRFLYSRFRLEVLKALFDPNLIRKRIKVHFTKKMVMITIGNVPGSYVLDLNDHLGYNIFIANKVDTNLIAVGKKINFTKENILLDIGANTGLMCIPFALFFNCEVIAIEASKVNSSILLENAALNNAKLFLHAVCVTDHKSALESPWIKLFGRNGNSGATSTYSGWNPSKKEVEQQKMEIVPATTLDDLIPRVHLNRIGLIKIDVEGAEALVLKGFSNIFSIHVPIIFEYRTDLLKRVSSIDVSEFINILELHYKLFSFTVSNNKLELRHFDYSISQENAIGLPKDKLEYFLSKFEN